MNIFQELDNYINNLNKIPYGEVIEFANSVDLKVNEEINNLETRIQNLRDKYRKFGEIFTIPKKTKYSDIVQFNTTMFVTIGGVKIECQIIEDYKDTLKFPYKPCIFRTVPNWFFIAFPELGQILPVREVNGILEYKTDLKNTKLHYGLFKNMPLEAMAGSDYAVFPYNKETWKPFLQSNKNCWSKYLKQLNVCQLSVSNKTAQKIPIFSTNCIYELSNKTHPEDMSTEWSLFVQLYFLLYVFKHTADPKHFTL